MRAGSDTVAVDRLEVHVFRLPTDFPEADGTLRWDATTAVVVEAAGGGELGLGYTYASPAAAEVVFESLAPVVVGGDALDVGAAFEAMVRAVRNLGRPGAVMMAVSAVDLALWDLKARLLGISLAALLGRLRAAVPIYGSGGFTSYPVKRLQDQLAGWVAAGTPRVKMKVGAQPDQDPARVAAAREAIGTEPALFVDANGAYSVKQALALAQRFGAHAVRWFEEPVSSDALDQLRLIRRSAPAGMDIAAGEYGDGSVYFRRMLQAGAVDVLQVDATRCGGATGFLRAAAIAQAFEVPLSAHCAPAIHAALCCCVPNLAHLEHFHDHVRVEALLFDGAPEPRAGTLAPDPSRPGLGLRLKRADAERYRI